jgi:hypothetical protein
VSPDGIGYRSQAIWSNTSTLVLTQAGAPELWSVLPVQKSTGTPTLAPTDRFIGLVDLYAALATGDAVVERLEQRGFIKPADIKDGSLPIKATVVSSSSALNAPNGGIIPLINLSGTGTSPEAATKLTLGATQAFLDVLTERQNAAKIPQKDRLLVRVLKKSDEPVLAQPRSRTLMFLILFSGLIATVAVAFARENLAGARSRRAGAGRGEGADPSELRPQVPAVLAPNELRATGNGPTPSDGPGRAAEQRESLKAVARPKPRGGETLGDKREPLKAVSRREAEGGARSSAGGGQAE